MMAIEAKRGCGFRKAGGLYVVGDLSNAIPVDYLPFCTDYPHCRSLVWAEPARLFRTCVDADCGGYRDRERIGLMWAGERHYSCQSFTAEARRLGVSKRVSQIPRDLQPGDPIALAHIAAVPVMKINQMLPSATADHRGCAVCRDVPAAKAVAKSCGASGVGDPLKVAGVFCLFQVRGVELVLPQSVADDPEVQRRCATRGVQIVAVPDDDPDHVPQGWRLPAWLRDDEPELPGVTAGDDDACEIGVGEVVQ